MPFFLAIGSNSQELTEVELTSKAAYDAFGRLRVSSPETLFDLTHIYDKQPVFVNELVASGGASTHLPNEATVQMAVTNTAGSRIVRQSRRYFTYQPAKSFLVYMSGVLSTTVNAGITARIGLFDNHADKTVDVGGNGFFFQYSAGVVSVVKRSYITGSQVDTVVNQVDWNLDKLDGTGTSGLTFDVTKAQIFWINAQWLGVGSVVLGVAIDGKTIPVHQFDHANLIGSVYATRISLPVRYELQRDSAAGVMKMICCSVISEGGHNPQGRRFSRTIVAGASVNAERPVLSIRLRSAYARAEILPKLTEVLTTTVDFLIYRIYLGTTLTGAVWTNQDATNSAVEFDSSATAFTGGRQVGGGFVSSATRNATAELDEAGGLASAINGTVDILTLTCESLSGNSTVNPSITWLEIV